MVKNQFNAAISVALVIYLHFLVFFQMAQRPRLGSMSDHSSPSSDTSENSESFDVPELRLDTLNLSSDVTESERQQIESFFAGLGTEVSIRPKLESTRISRILQLA